MAHGAPKLEECLAALERDGLLLLHDARLPSVATIVAGGPVKGSWWGHASGHSIFNTAEALEEHPDVAIAKLVDGKVTYVHRKLWGALMAVGSARAEWQTRGLPARALSLLTAVEKAGTLRTDLAALMSRTPPREIAKAALELEKRLLVCANEVHTESGAHAKQLLRWSEWAERSGFSPAPMGDSEGRAALEAALAAVTGRHGSRAKLPWR